MRCSYVRSDGSELAGEGVGDRGVEDRNEDGDGDAEETGDAEPE